VYEDGSRTSPFCQDTEVDHSGAVGDEEIEGQWGLPERLRWS
jgi:hypothetical protein